MTVDVYNYYDSVRGEVMSCMDTCSDLPIIQSAKGPPRFEIAHTWKILELLFAFTLSLLTVILLVKMAHLVLFEVFLFFSLVMYISLFVVNAQKYLDIILRA